jgi:hypothetical protein
MLAEQLVSALEPASPCVPALPFAPSVPAEPSPAVNSQLMKRKLLVEFFANSATEFPTIVPASSATIEMRRISVLVETFDADAFEPDGMRNTVKFGPNTHPGTSYPPVMLIPA